MFCLQHVYYDLRTANAVSFFFSFEVNLLCTFLYILLTHMDIIYYIYIYLYIQHIIIYIDINSLYVISKIEYTYIYIIVFNMFIFYI